MLDRLDLRRVALGLVVGQIQHSAGFMHLPVHMDVKVLTNFVLHKKKGADYPAPTSDQAMMSVIAEKLSA